MTDRRELERLIAVIDEEIRDARRDIKEAETVGDVEVIRSAQPDIAHLVTRRLSDGRHLRVTVRAKKTRRELMSWRVCLDGLARSQAFAV